MDKNQLIKIDQLMPGIPNGQFVRLKNQGTETEQATVYAKVNEPISEEEKNLLKSLYVTIIRYDTKEILYHGPLFDYTNKASLTMHSYEKRIDLGAIVSGQEQVLYISLKCPKEYVSEGGEQAKVDWVFRRIEDTPAPTMMATAAPSSTPTAAPGYPYVPSRTKNPSSEPTIRPSELVYTFVPVLTSSAITPTITISPEPEETNVVVSASPEATTAIEQLETEGPTEPKETPVHVESETEPSNQTEKETVSPTQNEHQPDVVYPTKTGNVIPIYFWSLLLFLSLIGMIMLIISWIRAKDKGEMNEKID